MTMKLSALLAVAVLAFAGCGGDDDGGSTDSATSGASGTSGVSGASYDITAGEFLVATDKEQILLDFAADNPECEGAIDEGNGKVDEGFLLDISARATDLDPDAPIGDEILDACTP